MIDWYEEWSMRYAGWYCEYFGNVVARKDPATSAISVQFVQDKPRRAANPNIAPKIRERELEPA